MTIKQADDDKKKMKGLTKVRGVWHVNKVHHKQRLYESTGEPNRRKAEAKAKVMIEEFIAKVDNTPIIFIPKTKGDITVKDMIDELWALKWKTAPDGKQSKRLAESALQSMVLLKYGQDYVNATGVDDLNIKEAVDKVLINKYKIELANREPAIEIGTQNRYLTAIRSVLNYSAELGHVDAVPKFKLAKEPSRCKVFTDLELERMTAEIKSLDTFVSGGQAGADFVLFQVETGARVNETLRLTWDHNVDLIRKTVLIPESKFGLRRTLPMTDELYDLLSVMHASVSDESSRLFDAKWTVYTVDTVWAKARLNLGYTSQKDFVVHSLRHTCASRLAREDVPLVNIGAWLGHKSLETTKKYAHLCSDQLNDAKDKLNERKRRIYATFVAT
jgi:integrase